MISYRKISLFQMKIRVWQDNPDFLDPGILLKALALFMFCCAREGMNALMKIKEDGEVP